MERKINYAKSKHTLEEYDKVDEELLLFGDIVETVKIQSKDVLINEMNILQERLKRLQNGIIKFGTI